jgi:hypothetical protein
MTRAMAREMAAARARNPTPVSNRSSPVTPRMQTARRWTKRYRPSDPHKRHRLDDDQPKTQQVVSYRRRT